MSNPGLDYDLIADVYDDRYRGGRRKGISGILRKYSGEKSIGRILEVGCGTGAWLDEIDAAHKSPRLHGLDISRQMLLAARRKNQQLVLVNGSAGFLPYATGTFDLVICLNAIHHFPHPDDFIIDAGRILDEDGRIMVIGMDPHANDTHWYLYDYFESIRQTDLNRFPATVQVCDWLESAGFNQIAHREIDRVVENFSGSEVLANPFLQKSMCSQLALLSDEAYQAGLNLIHLKIEEAEKTGVPAKFEVSIGMDLITGIKVKRNAQHVMRKI